MSQEPPATPTPVVVVGAGIAGLVIAHRLRKSGVAAITLEAEPRVGGVLRSMMWGGSAVEGGPNSFLAGDELLALLNEIGLAGDIEESAPGVTRRYIVRGARLQALPGSPLSFLTTRALSLRARLRVLLEPVLHGRAQKPEESLRDFVERHFGTEIYRFVAAPFVSGVYAGDPERISFAAAFPALAALQNRHPSLFIALFKGRKGTRRRHRSIAIRGGNARLAEALGRELGGALRLAAPVVRIERGADGAAGVTGGGDRASLVAVLGDGTRIAAARVVLALPAFAAGPLVRDAFPDVARALGEFPVARVAVVHVRVGAGQLLRPLDGFGHLVPRGEGFRHLGCIWSSALFPSRTPSAGGALFTVFLGGVLDPGAALLDEADAVALADHELRSLGLYRDAPLAARRDPGPAWIGQYELGHLERVATADRLSSAAGIVLAGSSYRGVSVGDCVKNAEAVAARLLAETGAASG